LRHERSLVMANEESQDKSSLLRKARQGLDASLFIAYAEPGGFRKPTPPHL
jgi:hypothetical protein